MEIWLGLHDSWHSLPKVRLLVNLYNIKTKLEENPLFVRGRLIAEVHQP